MMSSRVLLFLVLLPVGAMGQGLEWAAGAGLDHYDNIEYAADGGHTESVGNIRTAVRWVGASARHDEEIVGSATYANYLDNTFSDEFIWDLNGAVNLHLVPERLTWRFEDNYAPITANQFESPNADNRTYANYFTTGPSVVIGAGRSIQLTLDGEYGRASYGDLAEESDSDEITVRAALQRPTSNDTIWSLNVESNSLDYDAEHVEDYDRKHGYLRYEGVSARTRLEADAGVTRLEYLGDSWNRPLVRVLVERDLAPRTTLSLFGGAEYSSAANRLRRRSDPPAGTPPGGDVDLTTLPAPLREKYASAELEIAGTRTTLTLGADFSQQDYESDEPLSEQQTRELTIELIRVLRPSLELLLQVARRDHDFEAAVREDDDERYAAMLSWRVGRKTFLTAGYRHITRDSTLPSAEYEVDIVSLGFYYSPSGERWTFSH